MKTDPTAPAFPVQNPTPMDYTGLTKREWFAGLAMQGYIANTGQGNGTYPSMAKWAVQNADALIAALNKEEQR